MNKRTYLLLGGGLLGTGALGALGLYAARNIAIPFQDTQPTSVPAPSPTPVVINQPERACVNPDERVARRIQRGDNVWDIAVATLRRGEDINERVAEIMRISRIEDPLRLRVGEILLVRNNGLMPELYPRGDPGDRGRRGYIRIELMEEQPLSFQLGLEGFLCGTQLRAYNLQLGATFDNETNTLEWTPGILHSGLYSMEFIASDPHVEVRRRVDVDVYQGKVYEFITDGDTQIKYWVVPGGVRRHPILTLDKKTGYTIDLSSTYQFSRLREARESASNKEIFIYFQRLESGYDLTNFQHWTVVLDHIRRIVVSQNNPETIEPFYLSGDRGRLPILRLRITLPQYSI